MFFFGFLFPTNSIGSFSAANQPLALSFSPRVLLCQAAWINLGVALLLVGCSWAKIGGLPLFFGILFLCVATIGVILPNATAITMQPFAAEGGVAGMAGHSSILSRRPGWRCSGPLSRGSPSPIAIQIGCFPLAAAACFLFPRPICWTKKSPVHAGREAVRLLGQSSPNETIR